MKVLLTPIGSHGDVHPFVGLGMELARRGHAVTLVTNPIFRTLAEKAGLPFVPLGTEEQFQQTTGNPDIWHPIRGVKLLFRFVVEEPLRQLYQIAADLYEPGNTVAVNSPIGFGTRLAQEKLGLPLATVHICPCTLRSITLPPVFAGAPMPRWSPHWYRRLVFWLGDTLMMDRIAGGPLNEFRAELGLPPVRRLAAGWWNSPQRVLGLFPAWFAPPQPDWPPQTRLTGHPLFDERGLSDLPRELEEFLAAGEPPVVFTPGSAMRHGQQFFKAAVDACRELGRRAILLTRFVEHLPPSLPDGISHFKYVAFSQVFPRAAAVVHHGGAGTTGQGLAAGVPQLFMPLGFDQPDNAARVVRLGAGAVVMPKRFTGRNVARALRGLLTPQVRATCQEIAGRFRGVDAVGRACDLIEELPVVATSGATVPAAG